MSGVPHRPEPKPPSRPSNWWILVALLTIALAFATWAAAVWVCC